MKKTLLSLSLLTGVFASHAGDTGTTALERVLRERGARPAVKRAGVRGPRAKTVRRYYRASARRTETPFNQQECGDVLVPPTKQDKMVAQLQSVILKNQDAQVVKPSRYHRRLNMAALYNASRNNTKNDARKMYLRDQKRREEQEKRQAAKTK